MGYTGANSAAVAAFTALMREAMREAEADLGLMPGMLAEAEDLALDAMSIAEMADHTWYPSDE